MPESSAAETSIAESAAAATSATTAETTGTTAATTTTAHVSPTETVTTTLGTELSDIDALLDHDGTNSYNAKISDFIDAGDVIQSFTFVVYSEDGATPLGDYQGGYGIGVTADCPAATDENWYQSENFTQSVNSAYAEFTWQIPTDVQGYIDYNGEVMFGHWWSGVQTVRLSSIACTYTKTAEAPVDGTANYPVGDTLQYASDDKTEDVDLDDLIPAGSTLQTVTFDITAPGSLGKFTGAFGVSVAEGAACETSRGWYQTRDISIYTDNTNLSLTWILPEDVKASISSGGHVELGFWYSEQASVTLNSVSARYSTGSGTTTTTPSGGDVTTVPGDNPDSATVNRYTSAQIVADIQIGWNLGNSLESYDTGTDDTETGWGNPKTTAEMFQTVKNAGFNAVRIPVTWGEHMSDDGTIDADWMARVKEVVDYAYNLNLYIILNVHHDDYLWLTPTAAELDSDRQTLSSIWTQIASTFASYDHRLLFEGMNEPRVVDSAEEWTGGTAESQDAVNQLEQAFVDAVRATGGNNATRTLIVTTYAQSIEQVALDAMVVPDDDYVIVSVHSYAPWDFCSSDSDRADWGSDADEAGLQANFQSLYDKFISRGIPVLIDEFGSVNKNNTEARAEWFQDYIEEAGDYGIKCFVWDNNVASGDSSFGLYDRDNDNWYYPTIIEAIMDAAYD